MLKGQVQQYVKYRISTLHWQGYF